MIIKNGLVIDPASGLSEKMDLLIEDGIIKEMATQITKEGEDVLDATGFVVAPGLIDTHVHFRDPGFTYKETIHTGALASARGSSAEKGRLLAETAVDEFVKIAEREYK